MSITVPATEFKAFMSEKRLWSDDIDVDGAVMFVDGKPMTADLLNDPSQIDDDAKVTLESGIIYTDSVGAFATIISYFRLWQRWQETVVLQVEAPSKHERSIREAIETLGGVVL